MLVDYVEYAGSYFELYHSRCRAASARVIFPLPRTGSFMLILGQFPWLHTADM